jgi:hypothetical protein
MARRRKGAVRKGHGIRCLICGKDCGKGGALAHHVPTHQVTYDQYKRCFNGGDWVINESKLARGGEFLMHTRVIKIPVE